MEVIFAWVKSVVFYLILLTVVTHLMPNKKYEKYVRLFTGMLLVMIVIKPVTQVFSIDETFDRNFFSILEESESMVIEEPFSNQEFENVQEEQMLREYEKMVETFADVQAGNLGLDVVRFQTQVEEKDDVMFPASIEMEVTIKEGNTGVEEIKIADIVAGQQAVEETEQTRQLKTILAEYYGMKQEQIRIVVT